MKFCLKMCAMLSSRLARGNNFTSFFEISDRANGCLVPENWLQAKRSPTTRNDIWTLTTALFSKICGTWFFPDFMNSFRWLPCLDLKNCWSMWAAWCKSYKVPSKVPADEEASCSWMHGKRKYAFASGPKYSETFLLGSKICFRDMVHLHECKRRENKHSPRYSWFLVRDDKLF